MLRILLECLTLILSPSSVPLFAPIPHLTIFEIALHTLCCVYTWVQFFTVSGLKMLSAGLVNVSRFSQLTQIQPQRMIPDLSMLCDTAPLVLLLHPGSAHLKVSSGRSLPNGPLTRLVNWERAGLKCSIVYMLLLVIVYMLVSGC